MSKKSKSKSKGIVRACDVEAVATQIAAGTKYIPSIDGSSFEKGYRFTKDDVGRLLYDVRRLRKEKDGLAEHFVQLNNKFSEMRTNHAEFVRKTEDAANRRRQIKSSVSEAISASLRLLDA